MKNLNDEYYFMGRDSEANYPILDMEFGESEFSLLKRELTGRTQENPYKLQFLYKVPEDIDKTDLFLFGGVYNVISEKLKNILAYYRMELEFIPAQIKINKDNLLLNYYLVHCCNRIKCVDFSSGATCLNKDICGNVLAFDKLVLDNTLLKEIPLEKRLVFSPEEKCPYTVYHQTIVDRIMQESPRGVKFYPISGKNANTWFRKEYYRYFLQN